MVEMPLFGNNYPDIMKREYGEKPFEDKIPPVSPAAGCVRRVLLFIGLVIIVGVGAASWSAVNVGQQAAEQNLQLTNTYLLQVAESLNATATATPTVTATVTPLSNGQMTLTAVASITPSMTATSTATMTTTPTATITNTPTITATVTASPVPPSRVTRQPVQNRSSAPRQVERMVITAPPQIIYVTVPPQIVQITVTPSPTKEEPPLPIGIPTFPDVTFTPVPSVTPQPGDNHP